MTFKWKIKESEYNLQKIIRMDQKLSNEYFFEINNFLSSAKSIFDHLLDDYALKYDLKIPLDTRNLRKTFHEKAKDNPEAEKFIGWFEQQYSEIVNNPQYGFLLKKRDISYHRKNLKPDKITITGKGFTVKAEPNQAVDVRIDIFSQNPKAIRTITDRKTLEKTEEILDINITQNPHFAENPDRTIETTCQLLLERIKKFALDANNLFK